MTGPAHESWPSLPLDAWAPTQETLHLWTQVVGKVSLALTRVTNHWWNCTFQVTPRGLTTGVLYHGSTPVEIAFDLVEHRLLADAGPERRVLALEPRSVADFHRELLETLAVLGVPVRIDPRPTEIADPVPFPDDDAHADYDRDAVRRFHRALVLADRSLRRWRAPFLGKRSPVHFFWGGCDMAVTLFSGRTAPPHPGGVPNIPGWVVRESYSHECFSAGWWPGNGGFGEAAFYAYAFPEPAGFAEAASLPRGARYHPELREYVLPWEDVVSASAPAEAVQSFLDAAWERAAAGDGWDPALTRAAGELERLEARVRAKNAPAGSRDEGEA